MAKLSIKQQILNWEDKLPIGSVWSTKGLTIPNLTVMGIAYKCGCVVIYYSREDAPNTIFSESAGAFYNYIVSHRIK